MKLKINNILPEHTVSKHSDKDLYISDYKHFKNYYGYDKYDGKVVILNSKSNEWKSVYLSNQNQVDVNFDGFEENALPIEKGLYNSQCECVLFPDNFKQNSWILFVETKYANNFENAFKEENDYPYGMTNQIIETVKYFREKRIIDYDRRVNAIVSFPNLVEEFNSYIFDGKISILDILKEHKILIRGTNNARIISEKRIKI